MSWLRIQMAVLDAASVVVSFAMNWLLQSTLLIAAGLAVAGLLRRRGSALQSAVYRTTLAAVFVCPLASGLLATAGVSGWSLPMPAAWTYEELSAPPVAGAELADTAAPAPPGIPAGEAGESMLFQSGGAAGNPPVTTRMPISEPLPSLLSDARLESPAGIEPPPDSRPARESSGRADVGPSVRTAAPVARFDVRVFGLVAIGIVLTWLSASAWLLARLGLAWRRLNRLCREAVSAEPAIQDACRELAALLDVAAPQVRRSPYLSSPCLAGWPRSTVLLPEADPSLPARDVLIHELAHLRRGDAAWNLVSRLAETMFFYQPLVWVLTPRLEAAAEEVCDDYVVQFGGDRSRYARGLVEIAELSTAPVGAAAVAIVSLRSILAKRVTRIMDSSRSLSTRAGNLLLAVVIAGGLAGTLAAGLVGLGSRSLAEVQAAPESAAKAPKEQADKAPAAKSETQPDEAGNAGEKPRDADAANEPNNQGNKKPASDDELHGVVTDADGKPVAGAKLYWLRSRVHDVQPQPPQLLATTGEDGRYSFAEPPAVAEDVPASWSYTDRIVVRAPGHGFVFTWSGEIRRSPQEGVFATLARAVTGNQVGTIKLPPPGEPIRGRLVNIDGRPVAGATVRIRWFIDENERLSGVEEAEARGAKNAVWSVRVSHLLNVIEPVQLRDALPTTTSDADGWFELRDIGPKRLVQLLVQGDGIEATEIVARNEPGEKIVIDADRHTQAASLTVYPNEFVHAVGPSKPVEGRVLDLDTGEPIAGAVVRAFQVHGVRLSSSREREHLATTTDEGGRYRITGLPVGDGNALVAFATNNVPYVPVARTADTSADGAAVQQDFRLKRGLWAEGRVFDAETRKPFTGEMSYYLFRNRELEEAIPGLRQAFVDGLYWTNSQGEFRVPVLPSRGVLAFRYDGRGMGRDGIDRFPRGFGADDIAGSEDLGGTKVFPTIPFYLMPGNYERIAEIPATNGEESVRVDMPLFASRPVEVRVVDGNGEPVSQFLAYGANERFGWQPLDGPTFKIQDLLPAERRKVFVFHRGRNLAGGGFVEFGAKETLKLELVEAGSVQGRLVDADGEPINDATLSVHYEKLKSADNSAVWAPHPTLTANPTHIPVDKNGRFRLDGLIPGWSYYAHASAPRPYQGQTIDIVIGTVLTGVEVKAGENKDLGDIVVVDMSGAGSANEAEKVSAAPPAEAKTVRGRVTRGGKPASGAYLAVVARSTATVRGGDFSSFKTAMLAEATADEKGEYVLHLAGVSQKTHNYANLIARQDDSAIAWRQLNLDQPQTEAAIELSDEEPIRGKLIDLEGQPAAGVQMSIVSVIEPPKNGAGGSGAGYRGSKAPAAWLAPVASDEQGEFVIHGVGASHGVMLEVAGDGRFAQQDIVLNAGWPEERGERDRTYRPLVKNAKPGEEAVLTLAPAQVFEGVVKYGDTNEPVPGARLTIWASQQEFGSMMSVAGQADDKGHYRITPKPGIRFGLTAYPPGKVPYLAGTTPLDQAIRWEGGERVKQVDLTLPRGVLVRGKVVEAASDVPVVGAAIQYLPETSNNRNTSDAILTGWQAIELTDKEGRFALAVLPGPGRLLISGPQGKYVLQEIGDRELSQGQPGGTRNYFHSITKLDPEAGQEPLELKIELRPGATVTGRVVDEQGQAIEEMLVLSRLDISPSSPHWRAYGTPTLGGRFELSGLATGVDYPVYFLDAKRQLGATQIVKAGDSELTVVLKPCGGATLRALDSKGEPVRNFANVQMVVTPGAMRYDLDALNRGEFAADADFVANVDRTNNSLRSDDEGRFKLPALIPGATYQAYGLLNEKWRVVKEFQVETNEMLDLGDLVVQDQQ
jgi:beta-lactamase regulating signal transducer with metallopeptidase domain